MNPTAKRQVKWMAAVVLLAAVDAFAQEQSVNREVLVSIPDRKMAIIEDGQVVKVYPVAVGAEVSPSPEGDFQIVNRLTNPTYYHKGTIIKAGPANPLGNRWIGLSQKGYGIHGTNVPKSIGKAASHGCIRMAKRDLEEVFQMLRVGDRVVIRATADDQTAQIFGSANATVAQAQSLAAAGGQ